VGTFAAVLALRRATPRNAILITIDTLRADRLSCYGYTGSQTPAIDRLAQQGARFSVAYCDVPWTTASLASVLTGTFSPRHGVEHFYNRLTDARPTLAEVLKTKDSATGAVVGSYAVDSVFGLNRGFETYDENFDTPQFRVPGASIEDVPIVMDNGRDAQADSITKKLFNNAYRPDREVTATAVDWLRAHKDHPFFLWVHYFGPHERITIEPGVMQGERIIADYDRDLRETDSAVGELLDALDALALVDQTLVVLHSDHGQALGEHGIIGHGRTLYEEAVRIPLLMRFAPTIGAGTVVDTVVRNVDIFPTIVDLLRAPMPEGLDGRSLMPAIEGKALPDAPAYMELIESTPIVLDIAGSGECSGPSNWLGVRLGSWKYMDASLAAPCFTGASRYDLDMLGINPTKPVGAKELPAEQCPDLGRHELYQLTGTAYGKETDNLNQFKDGSATASHLESLVHDIVSHREKSAGFELDEEQRNKLRSLGYLQ